MKFTIGFEEEDVTTLHSYWDEIIRTQQWSEGKFTKLFEERWSRHNRLASVAFSSWSGGALAALEYFDVKGHTVLCPSNTFMATPLSVIKAGGNVEFLGGTVMAAFVQRALRGEALIINGSGRNTRNYIYVEDLAEGNVAALQGVAANEIYNLEGKRPVTILEVAEAVRKLVKDVPIEHREAREGDFTGRTVSAQKAARELKWEPRVDIEEGIERYVAWYRAETVK